MELQLEPWRLEVGDARRWWRFPGIAVQLFLDVATVMSDTVTRVTIHQLQ